MARREQVLGDIADGELTSRHGIGAPERHGAIGWPGTHPDSAKGASDLGRAIDRLQAEVRSKDTGGQFSVEAARNVRDALWSLAEKVYPAIFGPIGAKDGKRLCLIVVMERNPPSCTVCAGVGSRWHHGAFVAVCECCNGAKYQPVTAQMRSQAYGCPINSNEAKALDLLLMLWDQQEHSAATAVADMYRDRPSTEK